MTLDWFLRQAWRRACGLPEEALRLVPDLDELRETQWCPEFEQHMRDRLVLGAFRYGLLPEDRAAGRKFDSMGSIERHLLKYRETGNSEHLVDVANLCMVEYYNPAHPDAHFRPLDDGDHHAEVI